MDIKYGCLDTPNYIGTSARGGIKPIDGKIYWHLDEASLTRDMEKYKVLFAIEKGFQFWQEHFHHVSFESTNDKQKAAIVIRFKSNGQPGLPIPFQPGVLAYAYYPYGESLGIHSDVFLNDAYRWDEMHKAGSINLFKVFVHELGHAFGLAHSTNIRDILYPQYQPNDTVLATPDTVAGIHKLYGNPPKEEDPTNAKEYVQKFIRHLIDFRGEKFLKDITEKELILIARAFEIPAVGEDLKKDTIKKVLKAIGND